MRAFIFAAAAAVASGQDPPSVSLPGGGAWGSPGYFGDSGLSYTIGSDDAWTTGTIELGTLEESGNSPRAATLTLQDGQIVQYTAGDTVMVDKLNGANVNIYGGVLEGSNFVMVRASTPDGDGSCNTIAGTSPGAWGAAAGQSPGHAAWLLYNMDTSRFTQCQGDGWCGSARYDSCRSTQYTKTWTIGMTMAVGESLTGTADGVLFAAMTNSDCGGTWSCSEACEAATDADRTFTTTTLQQGTGAACPTAPTADCAYGNGACFPGCMDEGATNYDPLANSDDGSCVCDGFRQMQHNRAVCSSCIGDMDGNQIVNVMDIMALLGDFGLCDPRLISDGTNDGCVGIQDLLLLLVEFGTDCTDICIRGRDAEDATMRGPWVELAPDVQGDADIPSAWWSDHCDAGPDVPPDDFVILVKMGEVRDYFTAANGQDLCSVLMSSTKHAWSAVPEGPWVVPGYNSFLGGSANQWPIQYGRAGDDRGYLSFWGGPFTGGCCSTDYTPGGHTGWGTAFSLYAAPKSCF